MERIYNIKNSTLKIIFGDILCSDKEVIVSSDDGIDRRHHKLLECGMNHLKNV